MINEALRINRRNRQRPEKEWNANLPEAPPTVNEALAKLQREDRTRIILEVLARMLANEALVLHLFYLEEHSVKETAYCTSLSTNNVKVLLSRGRKRFYALCQDLPGQKSIAEIL